MSDAILVNKPDAYTEPLLWINRVAILPSGSPGIEPIRNVILQKGLNVVWAKEPERYDPQVGISGHSAGKTSFCRLLRYILGESTFATAGNETVIGSEFPEGYVGGEVRILGKNWAVLRPLSAGRLSYAAEVATIEDLIAEKGKALSQVEYLARLGLESFVSSLPIRAIPQTGEAIHWGHLLAWITRDQENRFRNLHGWRSPSSQSKAPAFRFRRDGGLFLLRAALGLVEPSEFGIIQAQEETEKALQRTNQQIESRNRDSERLVKHYRRQLEEVVVQYRPSVKTEEGPLFDQPELHAEEAIRSLDHQTNKLIEDRELLQQRLDDKNAEVLSVERSSEEMRARFGLNGSARAEISDEADKKPLAIDETVQCPVGLIPFWRCDYYQRAKADVSEGSLQDAREREQAEARRTTVLEQIEAQLGEFSSKLLILRKEKEDLLAQRSQLNLELEGVMDQLRELRFILNGYSRWTNEVLVKVPSDVKKLNEQAAKDEQRLRDLASEHQAVVRSFSSSLSEFESIFASLVEFVLGSNGYQGTVKWHHGMLGFDVTERGFLSGEAVRTLTVLLSDLACMVYGATQQGRSLPGFLLHDSPRDADLGAGLYERLFLLAVELTDQLGGKDACCFQYIVTTTTAPPSEVVDRGMVRLRLDASNPTELLFRRRFNDLGGLFADVSIP